MFKFTSPEDSSMVRFSRSSDALSADLKPSTSIRHRTEPPAEGLAGRERHSQKGPSGVGRSCRDLQEEGAGSQP